MNPLKYFKPSEVAGLQPEVATKLDDARGLAGIPFRLTSTLRTVDQNAAAGGVADSAHLRGWAADLSVHDSNTLFLMISALLKVGFQRLVIGIRITDDGKVAYHNLHCDLDDSLPHPIIAVKRYE